jgi:hypothetical protein
VGTGFPSEIIFHEPARALVAALGMERWTPHDLRRTAGALLDREGYVNEQVGHLLAHTRRGTTSTYTPVGLWTHFDIKRQMANTLDRMLREILNAAGVRSRSGAGQDRCVGQYGGSRSCPFFLAVGNQPPHAAHQRLGTLCQ